MEWSQVSYHYDGSFAGFLCCVFAAYLHREAPACFLGPEDGRFSLWPEREIVTEQARAKRVYQSLDKKIGVQGRSWWSTGFSPACQRRSWPCGNFSGWAMSGGRGWYETSPTTG